jgi:hypothetical protein
MFRHFPLYDVLWGRCCTVYCTSFGIAQRAKAGIPLRRPNLGSVRQESTPGGNSSYPYGRDYVPGTGSTLYVLVPYTPAGSLQTRSETVLPRNATPENLKTPAKRLKTALSKKLETKNLVDGRNITMSAGPEDHTIIILDCFTATHLHCLSRQ